MDIFIYIILQVVNVVLGTVKNICTVKSSKLIAAITNSLSYTFNAAVTIFLVKQEMWIAILVTFFCNFLGVPLGKAIVERFSKDRLWIFSAAIKMSSAEAIELKQRLKELYHIDSNFQKITYDQLYSFTIYSHNKDESRSIVKELSMLNGKYHIVEAI